MQHGQKDARIQAIDAFLEGLTTKDAEKIPFAPDIVLRTPLDPEHPPTFHGSIIAGPSTIHLVWDA